MKLGYLFIGLTLISRTLSVFVTNGVAVVENPNDVQINLGQYKQVGNKFTTAAGKIKYKSQQEYKGVPIFGATMVVEEEDSSTELSPVYGTYHDTQIIKDDFNDDVNPSISNDDALKIAINNYIPNGDVTDLFGYEWGEDTLKNELMLYQHENIFYLSYIIEFTFLDESTQNAERSFTAIDAKTGDIIYTFSSMIGQDDEAWGTGGNAKIGDQRHGPMPIDGRPDVSTERVRVYDYISSSTQNLAQCQTIGSFCEIQDYLVNTAPNCLADGFSYATATYDVYTDWIPGDVLPVAPQNMPLRFCLNIFCPLSIIYTIYVYICTYYI